MITLSASTRPGSDKTRSAPGVSRLIRAFVLKRAPTGENGPGSPMGSQREKERGAGAAELAPPHAHHRHRRLKGLTQSPCQNFRWACVFIFPMTQL